MKRQASELWGGEDSGDRAVVEIIEPVCFSGAEEAQRNLLCRLSGQTSRRLAQVREAVSTAPGVHPRRRRCGSGPRALRCLSSVCSPSHLDNRAGRAWTLKSEPLGPLPPGHLPAADTGKVLATLGLNFFSCGCGDSPHAAPLGGLLWAQLDRPQVSDPWQETAGAPTLPWWEGSSAEHTAHGDQEPFPETPQVWERGSHRQVRELPWLRPKSP